jgi:type IV pilus assembly protein PilY1
MNISKRLLALIALLPGLAVAPATFAQTLLTDSFTDTTSSASSGVGNWLYYNGACLTAGIGTGSVAPAPSSTIPACTDVLNSYYHLAQDADVYLVGGANGFLGGFTAPGSPAAQVRDPAPNASANPPVPGGALRFTNGSPFGNQERGAIVSTNAYPTTAGIQVTFKTVTYGGSGADGISFYLMDGCVPVAGATGPSVCALSPTYYPGGAPYPGGLAPVPAIGATGGSLAYTCSNTNGPASGTGVTYDGLTGAYLGLGIDEYGNFLNQSDNTANGYGFQPGRIGLRGAGAISWPALSNAYGTNPGSSSKPYYPASLSTAAQQIAIQQTCSSGHLWNYANAAAPTDAGPATLANSANTASILDYAPIPGANLTLPPGQPLFNGSATTRAQATPIFYNLQITSDGYLSLSYAYNGGSYLPVISNQSISASNGPLPAYVRFGFAGSTGGATNVHEILCFKSAPAVQSASSAGVNEKQSAKVETGTFAYFAYYDQNNWVGRVTANALNTDSSGNVTLATTPSWDASCVLTGIPLGQTCSTGVAGLTAAMAPSSRVILTYNGGGVPFEWGSLSTAQQAALTLGEASSGTAYELNYLRGDRSDELTSAGTCAGSLTDTSSPPNPVCFRARTSVLADIVDSSPTWVGPPQSPYTATWQDKLYPATDAMIENSGAQNYLQYQAAQGGRPNVVYVGSNDGMLHGFRSGSFLSDGTFSTATTPNDGREVLAYLPGSLLLSASNNNNPACSLLTPTGSVVQNIHGVTPANGSNSACVTTALDFSSPHYGHNFFVDATPGSGDLFYDAAGGSNPAWHTWLVGGLGAGGAAIFALDVTDPTTFAEGNASNLVVGEWNSATINCVSNATCGNSLGNTFGTPIIRRLHDGRWAVIFGNGYGSTNGDAGIFVMTVDSTGAKNFYYLSTGNTGGSARNNGIGYVSSADLDGDHITDYVYAGDLLGNLWRFDLTSATESSWAVSRPGGPSSPIAPLFTAPSGQAITTAVTVSSGATAAGANTLMVAFGTGMRTQFNNASPVTFESAGAIYGVWDWSLSSWNASSSVQYAALSPAATGLGSPYTLSISGTTPNLQQQSFTLNTDGVTRDINNPTAICWAGSATCTSGTPMFGWYVNMIGGQEQIIYNPQLLQGVFTVNSVVPANNQALACTTNTDSGFTYAISVLTGASVPNFFVSYHDTAAAGIQTNAVGSSFPVTSATGSLWLVSQTVTNQPILTQVNPGANGKGRRLTWVQLR